MTATSSRLRSRAKQQPSRNRHARKRISYKEDTSESDESNEPPSEDEYQAGSHGPPRRRSAPRTASSTPKDSHKRKATDIGQGQPLNAAKKAKISNGDGKEEKLEEVNIHLTGKPMPLHTLPYQILVSIFDYASRPLMSDTFQPTSSVSWLLQVALCCRAFAEPALSALYYSPPLAPPNRAHALRSFLASHSKIPTFNYGAKIKYLDVEASTTLLLKHAGLDPMNLAQFTTYTPQLRGICVYLLSDNPKYRRGAMLPRPAGSSSAVSKDIYGEAFLSSLQTGNISLYDWTWNQVLSKERGSLDTLSRAHRLAPFQSLRSISLVNYEAGQAEKGKRREELVAEALSELPQLRSVSFTNSSILNDRLMPLLPDHLSSLEVVDCAGLKSPAMKDFLVLKGQDLQQLILNHNNALNLSFITALAVSCPRLEIIKMDLRYFNHFFTIRDPEPKYKALFDEGDVPSWPTNLQSLELLHLRKWGLATAEVFFSSLTYASKALPKLRSLKIKASLDESGWRDRIGFRDKWTDRLRHVFLRRSAPPNPHLKSFAAFDAWRSQQHRGPTTSRRRYGDAPSARVTRKGLSNLSVGHDQSLQNEAKAEESDSDAPLVSLRRSARARIVRDDVYNLSESSPNGRRPPRRRRRRRNPDDSSSEDSAIDDDGVETPDKPESQIQTINEDLYIQGMCDVVDVLIDNLRPTEEHLNEDDFLDEEASGDEDWNGDDDMPGEGSYAW
ncbi:hypothetical protein P7C71_g5490, partial [Lecanoromycetidae sp. Uapishka_2]